jgi:NADPH:quinone reductase-like Zn-dependent oxidoreductase
LTAYRAAFTRGRLTKDDVVFIPGAGSGVQTFVLLYAKHAGARSVQTWRSTITPTRIGTNPCARRPAAAVRR